MLQDLQQRTVLRLINTLISAFEGFLGLQGLLQRYASKQVSKSTPGEVCYKYQGLQQIMSQVLLLNHQGSATSHSGSSTNHQKYSKNYTLRSTWKQVPSSVPHLRNFPNGQIWILPQENPNKTTEVWSEPQELASDKDRNSGFLCTSSHPQAGHNLGLLCASYQPQEGSN